jgi:citrate synthase
MNTYSEDARNYLQELAVLARENNRIAPELYQKYSVKRGLRNEDGSGVLVGLTELGDVHGYIFDEGEKVPDEGRLTYRGLKISKLVDGYLRENRFGFEEICYFLLFGSLPDQEQLKRFNSLLGEQRELPPGFTENMILKAPSTNIMNKLARSVLVCYSYDDNPDDIAIENVLRQCIELIARFPTMTAYGYQAKSHYHLGKSLYIHKPRKDLSTAENLLHLIRPDSKYTATEARVLDLCLVLHAEHSGGNNSAFALHVVSSSDTDTYSAVAAGVGSLKGPKHGGANIKVIEMMEDIKANVRNWGDEQEVKSYLARILKGEAGDRSGLIYGVGHAVYTLSDPRAVLLKGQAEELAEEKNRKDEFKLYACVEKLAPTVFREVTGSDKAISANVDLYSGFVYSLLNIPLDLYTPIFAIARIAGWSAHRLEELISGGRIIRPAYKNVSPLRDYTPLQERRSSQ